MVQKSPTTTWLKPYKKWDVYHNQLVTARFLNHLTGLIWFSYPPYLQGFSTIQTVVGKGISSMAPRTRPLRCISFPLAMRASSVLQQKTAAMVVPPPPPPPQQQQQQLRQSSHNSHNHQHQRSQQITIIMKTIINHHNSCNKNISKVSYSSSCGW